MKFAIQSVDLLRIFLCVGPIPLPIRTVQLRQHLPKLPGDGRGVGRGGPNMLIDLRHGPQVVVVMVILVLIVVMPHFLLHPLYMLLLQSLHAVDQCQCPARRLRRL